MVAPVPSTPTALLIIRAWVEEGSAQPLRAQVRVTRDISTGIERTLTLAERDAVVQMVDGWLQEVLGVAAGVPDQ
jgi:hypothetical protein